MAAQVFSGLDRLQLADKLLRGRRLALLTNQTGVNRQLTSGIALLARSYRLTALLAPEHGISGQAQAGQEVDSFADSVTGLPVFSLYRKEGKGLTREALAAFDVLVYDLQDVGARWYTYLYTLAQVMQDCAQAGKPLLVLDRVNPLGGLSVQGTVIAPAFCSFVGNFALPSRYGLTVAEYARYVRDFLQLDLELHWVPLAGWQRGYYLDDTDLPWPPPSPNCPGLTSALCYAGTCLLEGCNLSEGRGTALPFEALGAPWLNSQELLRRLNKEQLPGIGWTAASFCPTFSKFAGQACAGIMLHIRDRAQADPLLAALTLLEQVQLLHPEHFKYLQSPDGSYFFDRLLGTDDFRTGRLAARDLLAAHAPRVQAFAQGSRAFHLY